MEKKRTASEFLAENGTTPKHHKKLKNYKNELNKKRGEEEETGASTLLRCRGEEKIV